MSLIYGYNFKLTFQIQIKSLGNVQNFLLLLESKNQIICGLLGLSQFSWQQLFFLQIIIFL